jgi:hypothetical protein
MEPLSTEWSLQYTKSGDTLAILAQAYGLSAKTIVEQNGVAWSPSLGVAKQYLSEFGISYGGVSDSDIKKLARVNAINHWVLSANGRCLPFDPGASLLGRKMYPCAGGGYAVFTDQSQIFLPHAARKPLPPSSPSRSPGALLSTLTPPPDSPMLLYGGIALGVVGFLYFYNKQKG